MPKKRLTIGRTLNPVALSEDIKGKEEHYFTLSGGREVLFTEVVIPAELVEKDTFVVQETNGRDQTALTPESLKDIIRTIKLQQFYPCIGVRRSDGIIEILDGSRRRASALLANVELKVLVTDTAITATEARNLAKDLQTAVEHNIREVGIRLQRLKDSGMSQKNIALSEGISQAKVTRALQAANAPAGLIALFPVQSELTFTDYKLLSSAYEQLQAKGISLSDLANNVSSEIESTVTDEQLAEDEVKNRIMKLITRESSSLTEEAPKDKTVTTNIWEFDDRNRFARKKVKGRVFSYEFNRVPKDLQDELDRMVFHVMKKHLNK